MLTGGPAGKIGSDESEGHAGTGVALFNRPLPVRPGKKILCCGDEAHLAACLVMSVCCCDGLTAERFTDPLANRYPSLSSRFCR